MGLQFEKPEPCKSQGCHVEIVQAEGGGWWIQHVTNSTNVPDFDAATKWLIDAHLADLQASALTVTSGSANIAGEVADAAD